MAEGSLGRLRSEDKRPRVCERSISVDADQEMTAVKYQSGLD